MNKTFPAFAATALFLAVLLSATVFSQTGFPDPVLSTKTDQVLIVQGQSRSAFIPEPLGEDKSDGFDAFRNGWGGQSGDGNLQYVPPGVYLWPVKGAYSITSDYGDCRDGCSRLHDGFDIAAKTGTPVVAIADAVISKISANPSGNCGIQVSYTTLNDNLYVTNCHLSSVASSLKVGQKVRVCEVIGAVGNTGTSSGPHLHFQLRPADEPHQHSSYYNPVKAPISLRKGLNCDNLQKQSLSSYSGASLRGKRIFIDPGHTLGADPGAVSGSVLEADLNLKVAMKLSSFLKNAGAEVAMTYSSGQSSKIGPSTRSNLADKFGADFLVSIHHDCDGCSASSLVYVPEKGCSENRCIYSERLASSIVTQLKPLVGATTGVTPESASRFPTLGVLHPNSPAVLVEVTSVSDPRAVDAGFQQKAAQAIFNGIAGYFGASGSAGSGYSPGSQSASGAFKANREKIYATVFCGDDEHGGLASGNGRNCDNTRHLKYVALPDRSALGKTVRVCASKSESCSSKGNVCFDVPMWDTGPWCTDDSSYVFGSSRPLAEESYSSKTGLPQSLCPNSRAGNPAGIDFSPALLTAFHQACGYVPRYFDWAFTG